MAAGYFSDGTTTVGLDGNPSLQVEMSDVGPIALEPWNKTQATLFQRGGGYLDLIAQWGIERYSRGDAEWYVYQKCYNLGKIGKGELMVNDLVYTNAICTGCTAAIELPSYNEATSAWSTWVQMRASFRCSIFETAANTSASYSAPATPGEYADRTSTGTFTFDVTQITSDPLQLVPSLRVQHVQRLIPRAYGTRFKNLGFGRRIDLQLEGVEWQATRAALEDYYRDFATTVRDQGKDLVGNGNTYSTCYLIDGPSLNDDDRRMSEFRLTFMQAPS